MKCIIKFDCDNAAFGETKTEAINEIARILDDLGKRLTSGHGDSMSRENFTRKKVGTRIWDVNGNTVGYAWLE